MYVGILAARCHRYMLQDLVILYLGILYLVVLYLGACPSVLKRCPETRLEDFIPGDVYLGSVLRGFVLGRRLSLQYLGPSAQMQDLRILYLLILYLGILYLGILYLGILYLGVLSVGTWDQYCLDI